MVHADQLHRVVDVVDEVLHGCARRRRELAVHLRHSALILGSLLGGKTLETGASSATTAAAGASGRREPELGPHCGQRLLPLR
jgi:hypothetical protein